MQGQNDEGCRSRVTVVFVGVEEEGFWVGEVVGFVHVVLVQNAAVMGGVLVAQSARVVAGVDALVRPASHTVGYCQYAKSQEFGTLPKQDMRPPLLCVPSRGAESYMPCVSQSLPMVEYFSFRCCDKKQENDHFLHNIYFSTESV